MYMKNEESKKKQNKIVQIMLEMQYKKLLKQNYIEIV